MFLNSGINFETGSLSETLPSSIIIIMAVPITGLVMEAMRKRESRFMGALVSRSMTPAASTQAI